MKKSELPLYKTGWFYLLVLVVAAVGWLIHIGKLNQLNQWNRELLYQILPNRVTDSAIMRVKINSEGPSAFQSVKTLMARFPNASLALLIGPNNAMMQQLNRHISSQPTRRSILIATDNRASAWQFTNGDLSLGWFSQSINRVSAVPEIKWVTAADAIYAPVVRQNNGATSLLWRHDESLYPSFAGLAVSGNMLEKLQLKVGNYFELFANSHRWQAGFTGDVFVAGESLDSVDLQAAIATSAESAPQLLLIEDGYFQQTNEVVRALARLEQGNYLVQGWPVILSSWLLVIFGLALTWFLIRFSLTKQLAIMAAFITLLVLGQYVAFSQMQWLPILPVLAYVFPVWLVLTGYHFERLKFIALRNQQNEILSLAAPTFFETQQFEKIQPWLNNTSPDLNLVEKVFDIALRAEAQQNKSLAAKLFEWINQTGIKHEGSQQKWSEYHQVLGKEQLESTLVIEPGQTNPGSMTSPIQNIENFGRYRVEGVLGKGAMGIVFQGVDPKINRHVAIKTLQLSDAQDDQNFAETRERFFREAETAGNLSHANIVTIYDVGDEGDLGYIAMDLLTGAPLSNFLKPENLLPAPLVYQLMIQITDALDYAHKQHVVHRDIKPANMIYDDDIQRVTLTDFGIACVADQSKTRTGTIMGSPFYMSPEQVLGKRVDGRSDIFSLGVTFYQLLSGYLPFNGESIASVAYHITKSKHQSVRHWDSRLPASAVRITNKALQKDISKRYQTMFEFKHALISALKRDFKKAPII
ncbi:serine/threonine-protein kinase [Aliikangiella coralliicola]|uniref:Protein kinase n=1 Tax=Aliikangiella coralliicola TaxID=2592383 RepID=A0A545UHC2_9GAMM|nr:serine/threonine-protein kinase [Aliikangiella coralliicola]TQV88862.1 protein kinase [Aliikangiella coralliicola]